MDRSEYLTCIRCGKRALKDPTIALCRKHWRVRWRAIIREELPFRGDPPKPLPTYTFPPPREIPIAEPVEALEADRPRSKHERQGLYECAMRQLGRFPIKSRDLYERVTQDYGLIIDRVFYCVLKRWRERNMIKYALIEGTYWYRA